jgi:hypothetical protein
MDPNLYSVRREHGVNITVKDESGNIWLNTLITIVPFVLLLGTPVLALCLLVYLILRSRTPSLSRENLTRLV